MNKLIISINIFEISNQNDLPLGNDENQSHIVNDTIDELESAISSIINFYNQ
ncbi:hypothetical protein DDB_G0267932 [Dictyostelium discoideum AX4]|uniref:Uncharacterized protein n=1 Tax=Dictyostelium discoideum TaxID=44689 RepID=Q55FV6_DICDI|nr:hypothetical protein DDB_G0267932 [Dictyostelium discoideum AX4]EAL73419.1 hypothetical protein DDB_G0267932 [Dictyostelium discoideum AX4]|eukprot:XP_647427.1 hypothetical protein DDB_G0267932 [Dictyostelium discoideum AX4]